MHAFIWKTRQEASGEISLRVMNEGHPHPLKCLHVEIGICISCEVGKEEEE